MNVERNLNTKEMTMIENIFNNEEFLMIFLGNQIGKIILINLCKKFDDFCVKF